MTLKLVQHIFCPICCRVLHLLHGSGKEVKRQFLCSPSLTQSTQTVMLLMTFDNVVLIVSEVPCAVPYSVNAFMKKEPLASVMSYSLTSEIQVQCSDMNFVRAPLPFC